MTALSDRSRARISHLYRQYIFETMDKLPRSSDDKLVAECAKYGLDVVWYEGTGMYLVGSRGSYYGVIGADWEEEGIDLPTVVAELAVFGPFGSVP